MTIYLCLHSRTYLYNYTEISYCLMFLLSYKIKNKKKIRMVVVTRRPGLIYLIKLEWKNHWGTTRSKSLALMCYFLMGYKLVNLVLSCKVEQQNVRMWMRCQNNLDLWECNHVRKCMSIIHFCIFNFWMSFQTCILYESRRLSIYSKVK
jgi:hypothetical protein